MKIMCGSDEPHPYPVRSFTYRTEQVRANEVQRVIVYSTIFLIILSCFKHRWLSVGLGFLWHVIFFIWTVFPCLSWFRHISSFSEHDNTVFICPVNAYFDYILSLGHIFTNICIIAYFWSYLDWFLTFHYISFVES
jgi:hypothetical protein